MVGVDTAEGQLTGTIVAKVEAEDGLLNLALLNHVLEDGDDVVHGDGGPSHTQDTVELVKLQQESRKKKKHKKGNSVVRK